MRVVLTATVVGDIDENSSTSQDHSHLDDPTLSGFECLNARHYLLHNNNYNTHSYNNNTNLSTIFFFGACLEMDRAPLSPVK